MVDNNCGIYMIYSNIDNRVYIGSSKNIKRRLERHLSELKLNKHKNIHLQRFSNKYGIENIKWKILDNCIEDDLLSLEIKRVEEFDSLNKGFNLEYPDRSFKTDEHKLNLSISIRNSSKIKRVYMYKNNELIEKGTPRYLSEKYNLDNSSIYKIILGKRKKHKGYTFKTT